MWYRVELNKDGSVASCAEVDACAVEGKQIRYVEADSRASAVALAARWWRMRAKSNANSRALYEVRKGAGLCCKRGCKLTPESGGVLCQAHRAAANDLRSEYRSGLRQAKRKPSDAEKAEMVKRVREHGRKKFAEIATTFGGSPRIAYRNALARALAEFARLSPKDFRAWLVAEIATLTPKKSFLQEVLEQHPAAAE